MPLEISFSTWNINGRFNKVLGDKTKNKDLVEAISDVDFMFLTETWSNENIDIPGFETVNSILAKPSSKNACRQSGGISLLFKNKFKNFVTIIKNTKNFLWIKISKETPNSDTDLYVCGTYIPPEKSTYFDEEIFEEFESDVIKFLSKGNVITLGDFNARTSKLDDFVTSEGSKHIHDTSENSLCPSLRQNFDSTINNHGKKLIELCKTCDLRILNGRTMGDSLGRPTFHGKNGMSVIDYIICNQNLMQNTKHLVVKPPCYLSDHSQIITWINLHEMNTIENDSDIHPQPKLEKLPFQYTWSDDSKDIFIQELKSNETQRKLENFINSDFTDDKPGSNKCLNEFQNILFQASKKSLKIKKKKRHYLPTNVANKKWFDKECRIKRHQLRKLANQKHRDPNNNVIRSLYHSVLKDYKQTLEMKKNKFHQDKVCELENATNDPILFWKLLKNSADDIKHPETSKTPSPSQWLNHFQTLHSEHALTKKQEETLEKLNVFEEIKNNFNELDQTITKTELLNATKKLKTKKAAYNDRIKNEMIKSSANILLEGYLKVFNKILTSGSFPEEWTEGLITPVYKSGNSLDTCNYRGICVSSCLGKLFCSILNARLMNYAAENKLIHPTQIGFIPGSRTADHAFTLKVLHDKYVKQSDGGKIYACFIDFKKAFDSVWHQGLYYKLLQNKIGGVFYNLIKDLYSNTKCAIKLSEGRTPFFPYKKGVRQGCILSPILFNLYINEIPELFKNTLSDPLVLPNGTTINSLLYADDLVILSKSKSGLQNCLNQLHEWCEKWLMEINLKKTKVMIFQKHNSKSPDNSQFHVGSNTVDITKEYTYLGLKLTQNGNFKLAQKQLCEKALRALYKIRKHLNFHKLSPKAATKIFDAIISPILLYNSEVWGAYEKNDLNKWDNTEIEKVHLRFCKLYLGVNRKASNIACRGELGKFPLLITIQKNIINYLKHILQLPDDSIVRQALNMSIKLYNQGKDSYYGYASNTLKTFYPNESDLQTAIPNHSTHTIVNKIKDKYIEFWKHKMINSSKLSFLCSFKKDYKIEKYLTVIKNPNVRRVFSQFRVSNHKLHIEGGRYENIPREQRTCKLCDSGEIEDEFHFAFVCRKFDQLRKNSNNILKTMFELNTATESKRKLLQHTMSSEDPVTVTLFSKFIFNCYTERENGLKSSETHSN